MKIKHKQWGIGTKLYELSGGYQILVNFDKHGKIQVLQKDCEEVSDNKVEKVENNKMEKVSDTTYELDDKKDHNIKSHKVEQDNEGSGNFKIKSVPIVDSFEITKNKKIVEAFRLGVVPGFAVQDITVGRVKEIKKVEKWLAKDSGSLMMIGQYGQGKSHIIRYIREKALDEGYLVGYCDIGEESKMHKPKSVFNTIMKSLEFEGKDQQKSNDLAKFLKLYAAFASKSNVKIEKNVNEFLKPGIIELMDKPRKKGNVDELDSNYFTSFIDYLCGDEDLANMYRFDSKKAIQDYQTSASIICNILSSIGNMAASMNDSKNNFKGLILIFDEGETIDSPALLSKQRDGGINFIKGLTEISNNNPDLLSEKTAKEKKGKWTGKWTGKKTNLIYSGMHKDTKFCNQKDNHVKCLFAFVEGESEVIDILEERGVEKIILNDFTNDEKYKLINKIIEIYKKAYDYEIKNIEKLKNILIKKLENSNNTRSVIKITVEAIELIKEDERLVEDSDENDYEKILR
jgi:hypothetical protein